MECQYSYILVEYSFVMVSLGTFRLGARWIHHSWIFSYYSSCCICCFIICCCCCFDGYFYFLYSYNHIWNSNFNRLWNLSYFFIFADMAMVYMDYIFICNSSIYNNRSICNSSCIFYSVMGLIKRLIKYIGM